MFATILAALFALITPTPGQASHNDAAAIHSKAVASDSALTRFSFALFDFPGGAPF
jgi:hypothetical protein